MTLPALVKISDLPAADTLDGTELVELAQDGTSVKATTQAVADLANAAIAAAIAALGIDAKTYNPVLAVNGGDPTDKVSAPNPFTYMRIGPIVHVMGTLIGGSVGVPMNDDITFTLPVAAGANGTGDGIGAFGNVDGTAAWLALNGPTGTKVLSNYRAADIDEGLQFTVSFQYQIV